MKRPQVYAFNDFDGSAKYWVMRGCPRRVSPTTRVLAGFARDI
jgi:hypothetical protein